MDKQHRTRRLPVQDTYYYCGPKTLFYAQNGLSDAKMVIEIKGHVRCNRNVGKCCLCDSISVVYVTSIDEQQCMPAEYVHRT